MNTDKGAWRPTEASGAGFDAPELIEAHYRNLPVQELCNLAAGITREFEKAGHNESAAIVRELGRRLQEMANSIRIVPRTKFEAEQAGFFAGRDGPNTSNCEFSYFATAELTKAWDAGRLRGQAEYIRTKTP